MVARMARSVAAIGRWVSLAQTLEPRSAAWSGAKVDRELPDVFLCVSHSPTRLNGVPERAAAVTVGSPARRPSSRNSRRRHRAVRRSSV